MMISRQRRIDMNEELPSNAMTNDIAHLALVSQFAASCVFMDHDDVMRLIPLMVHFGFTERQRAAIADLMLASMED
jgi:hypothetical protein